MQSAGTQTHLPQQFTSFVGRTREMAEIGELLSDPECRLLTLVGPGGVGKTRLAIAAASANAWRFPAGITFINLQPVKEGQLLLPTIAAKLNVVLTGQEALTAQICRALADKQILLILDNFEQLLDSSDVLHDLLHGSAVCLLVTSRSPLRLQEEWLYTVPGLALRSNVDEPGAVNPATQLFVERARRVHPSFSPDNEVASIETICQLVEGMPLAIELAAAWTGYLSCGEIAVEIKRDLSFLRTGLRNLPKRHRSIQATVDQTWKQLSEDEKKIFRRISVFRSGFLREAATTVAGASLPILASLIDRSLLRWEPGAGRNSAHGRYQIHELLRQYAAARLEEDAEDTLQTVARHGCYYTRLLIRWHDDMISDGDQEAAMTEIDRELDNVRAAWRWVATDGPVVEVEQAATVLMNYFWYSDRFHEARDSFENAIHALQSRLITDERDRAMAVILNYLAWHLMALGEFEASDEAAHKSHQIYRQLDISPIPGLDTDPRQVLCFNARLSGRYEEAIALGEAALAESQRRGHLQKSHFTHRMLCEIYIDMGELIRAQAHAEQAAAQAEHIDQWSMAYTHILLGVIACTNGEYDRAEQHYYACHDIFESLRHRMGVADALLKLGILAFRKEEYEAAERTLEEALAIFREGQVASGAIETYSNLASVALARGRLESAHDHLHHASFLLGHIVHYTPQTLPLFTVSAEFLQTLGEFELSVYLLTAISPHAFRRVDRAAIDSLLERGRRDLGEEMYLLAVAHGESTTADVPYAMLKTVLDAPLPMTKAAPSLTMSGPDSLPLIEPLTPREQEVLQLIAAGLTNQQIADRLIIALGTVKSYTSQIYNKLNVTHRTQAIVRAREIGLIP